MAARRDAAGKYPSPAQFKQPDVLPSEIVHEGVGRRALFTNVFRTLGASLVYQLALVASTVLIARMLGVSGRGAVGAAILIPTIVAYAGELGIPVATGHGLAKSPGQRARIIGTARVAGLFLSAVLIVVSLSLTTILPIDDRARVPALFFAAFIPLNLLQRIHLAVLQADMRMNAFNIVRISGAVLYLAVIAGFFVTGKGNIEAVVGSLLAANALWLLVAVALVHEGPWLRFDWQTARSLFGYGLRAHPGNVSPVDTLRLDQLVLALFLAPYDLGLYLAAMTFITANRMIGTSIGMAAFPAAMRGGTTGRSNLRNLVVVTMGLSVLAAGLEFVFGDWLLRTLLGDDFQDAFPVLVVLGVASIFMNLRQVLSDWLRGRGRPGIASAGEVGSLAVLAISVTLLFDRGVNGVAWAVLAASVAGLGFLAAAPALHLTKNLRPISRTQLILGVALVTAAIAGGLSTLIPTDTNTTAVVAVGLLIIAPLAWRVASHGFDTFEPITWFALAFLIMFVARPAWHIYANHYEYNGYDIRAGFLPALGIVSIGYAALLIGYAVPFGKEIAHRVPLLPADVHEDTVFVYSVALAAIGTALFGIFVWTSGGAGFLVDYISGRSNDQSTVFRGTSAYLYYAPYLGIPALLILMGFASRRTRLLFWSVALFPTVLAVMNSFGRGNRIWILPLVASLLVFFYLRRDKRPRVLAILALAFVIVPVFATMRESRFVEQDTSFLDEFSSNVQNPEMAWISTLESGDLGMFDALALESTVVPEDLSHQPGSLFRSVVAQPIPSRLWPGKPTSPDSLLNETLFPDRYEQTSYMPTYSFLGEAYLDFGILGVVIVMIFLGLFSRFTYEYFCKGSDRIVIQLLFASILPLMLIYARGNLSDTIGRSLFLIVPLFVVPIIARKRERSTHRNIQHDSGRHRKAVYQHE